MKKWLYFLLAVIFLSTLSIGCAKQEKAKVPYKIGINNAVTGGFAVYAMDYQRAYEMLAEKINAEGGINGHPVELVIRDSESDAVKSSNNVRSLADAGVLAIIGSPDFGLAVVDVPVAEEVKVP